MNKETNKPTNTDNHVDKEYIQTLGVGGNRETSREGLHHMMGGARRHSGIPDAKNRVAARSKEDEIYIVLGQAVVEQNVPTCSI